jgi:enamine deaminase RidA (YjgF/YER057c/UK114 family)
MPDGAPPPPDVYGQARRCLEIIAAALTEAGAAPEHVVRTRIFAARREDFEEIGRAHAEVFGETRPASTYVVVDLLDPRWLVEIEADAYVP